MNNNIGEIKKKALFGMFWRFGERITAQAISFIVSIVLARILLPEEYGIVAIVNIFIAIANVLVTSGLGTSLIQKKEADELDFSTIFYAGIGFSLIMYGVVYISAPWIAKTYENEILIIVLRVMGLRLPVAAINSVQQAYVSRQMIFKKFFFSTLFGTLTSAAVGITMAIKGFGVWALVAQYMTNSCIDTIVLFFIIQWKPKLIFSFKRFRELYSFGWRIVATGLLGEFFNQLKSMLIGGRYSSTDLAYYNRGESIPNLVTTNINSTLESVMFPAIAKVQDNKKQVKQAVRRMMKISSFIIIPLLLGMAAVAEPIIKILLTDKWLFSVPYLQIVCIQQCFAILNAANLQAIKAVGRSDILLKLELIKKPVFLVFILVALPISPLAIATANALYTILALLINSFPNKKLLDYSFSEQLKDVSPYLLLATSMAILVYIIGNIKLNMVILFPFQIFIGIGYYLIGAKLLKMDSLGYIFESLKAIKR
ncbi:lipopolysaccharide biosynthesis protein [Turicibacter sp. GALT-G1]|uniref:lipopolysaccharide biosynthesis protein n=1 Tax=Turicibacter sp. GALT-G1 TaxID=2951140 RepID=UPI0021D50108|nr:lipopolysaccharide biosynthesis protein [Turicibacter sp. GALT-G1]MCU7207419.1 lipopolysaccharide biosynthesis protein [Turicibacter sp. GALT-G1]